MSFDYVRGLPAFDALASPVADVPTYSNELRDALLGSGSPAAGDFMTGWMPYSADSPYTASPNVAAIKFGPFVTWRGWIDPDTDWGAAGTHHILISNVPADLLPIESVAVAASSRATSVTAPFRLTINAVSGRVEIRCDIANHSSGVYLGNLVYAV